MTAPVSGFTACPDDISGVGDNDCWTDLPEGVEHVGAPVARVIEALEHGVFRAARKGGERFYAEGDQVVSSATGTRHDVHRAMDLLCDFNREACVTPCEFAATRYLMAGESLVTAIRDAIFSSPPPAADALANERKAA